MRNLILMPILAICVFFPANALSLTKVDYKEEYAKWMKVLRTGDFHEKEVALSKLWFVYREKTGRAGVQRHSEAEAEKNRILHISPVFA